MKLYLKQKVFSWRDRFFVKDENGGDSYELDIADPRNELLCLCVALAVDCALAMQDAAAGSGG